MSAARRLGAAVVLAVAAASAYRLGLRDRCLSWGATDEEVDRTMAGDELMPDPDVVATRAVTIDAPPSAVWPWLEQMGSGRGGAYTYDWIENLFGLGMHSADGCCRSSRISPSATRSSWVRAARTCGSRYSSRSAR
ncbi:MAG: hypothetical protein ACJ740_04470 [Gaiellales bacterium]